MSAIAQTSNLFPARLRDWEHTLTRILLRADGGNADAIRSFEITPETLAAFFGLGPEHGAAAEAAFRAALVDDSCLTWCLQNGPRLNPTAEMPNCIAILAFSLLVDTLLDGEYEGIGQYRHKLRQWLGSDRTFSNLRGIAIMWHKLAAWLNDRVDEGKPFRRLILPEIPPGLKHIGYTRYLSFPTRRDLLFLRKQIERSPRLTHDPVALVRLLDPVVHSSSVSFGLQAAFYDFRMALRSGVSVDHRFWRLVSRARALAGSEEVPLADLRMEFDEDGARHYQLRADGSFAVLLPPDLGAAVTLVTITDSPNLGPSVRRGVLFFRSSGLASWTAAGEPPHGAGRFHLAIAERHVLLASGTTARFERSGAWQVTTEPVALRVVSDVLARLGIGNAREGLLAVGLIGGVHIRNAWLGLPRYLPRIEGAAGNVDVRALNIHSGSSISCVAGELTAIAPVEGEFIFDDPMTGWSRRATFVTAAEVHAELGGANYTSPLLEEWMPGKVSAVPKTMALDLNWEDGEYSYQDVLEALYATSRSGSGEGDVVALIDRVIGRRSWEMLRTLQEATFLDARLRLRWRGRVFTLGIPTLTTTCIGSVPAVVVSGAVPGRLETDFRRTIELQGGQPIRRLGASPMAPPLLAATDVDPTAISAALGWQMIVTTTSVDGTVANRLCESQVIGETYELASAWDWSSQRFRAGVQTSGAVQLARLMHPGRRDHDLFRVEGYKRRTFTSRHAAIIEAYVQAGLPLFAYKEGRIRRSTAEGALPLEVARALRLRTLRNAGASTDGWEYPLTPVDARWLGDLLPGMIEGIEPKEQDDLTRTYLRGRGARRPTWISGGLVA